MKHYNLICAATLLFLASCTSATQNKLPEKPKDKQVYKDDNGSSWIWNAAAACWMMRAANGATYQYHPTTGSFTNASGAKVTPPAHVSRGLVGHSGGGRAVFGSTGRSVSVSA